MKRLLLDLVMLRFCSTFLYSPYCAKIGFPIVEGYFFFKLHKEFSKDYIRIALQTGINNEEACNWHTKSYM